MRHVCMWVVVAALLAELTAGCGQKASDTVAENAIEAGMKAQGQNADVKIDSDSMQITTQDGAMSFGEGTKLPDNWPNDVPVYTGLKLASAIATGDGFSVQGTTGDAQDKVAAFYKEQAVKNGWVEDTTMTQPQMVM